MSERSRRANVQWTFERTNHEVGRQVEEEEKFLTAHHERDQETELDYRGARFYDADIGRFLSLDPLAVEYPTLSDYSYVLGNPISLIDPTGRYAVYVDGILQEDMTERDIQILGRSLNVYFESKVKQQEYIVDKELEEAGLNPNEEAEFSLESVEKVKKLKNIKALEELGAKPKETILLEGDEPAFTRKGIVTLYSKNFKSWRYLATSFGHELVHILNVNLYWDELYKEGYIGENGKFPNRYNELLAHSWSLEYSGIGDGAVRFYLSASKDAYGDLVEKFFQKHRIRPQE